MWLERVVLCACLRWVKEALCPVNLSLRVFESNILLCGAGGLHSAPVDKVGDLTLPLQWAGLWSAVAALGLHVGRWSGHLLVVPRDYLGHVGHATVLLLKCLPNAEPLGKCMSIIARNFLATLVLTSSCHWGLNQITFLLRYLFLATVFSVYWSLSLYPEASRALLYTSTSASKTSLLEDRSEMHLPIMHWVVGVLLHVDGVAGSWRVCAGLSADWRPHTGNRLLWYWPRWLYWGCVRNKFDTFLFFTFQPPVQGVQLPDRAPSLYSPIWCWDEPLQLGQQE